MSRKMLLILLGIFLAIMVFWSMTNTTNKSPVVNPSIIDPTPKPTATPKTFEFDKNTDLKKELELVNPEVLESDFN